MRADTTDRALHEAVLRSVEEVVPRCVGKCPWVGSVALRATHDCQTGKITLEEAEGRVAKAFAAGCELGPDEDIIDDLGGFGCRYALAQIESDRVNLSDEAASA